MRLHIDTDFAGNPDDACALAMVLGWPDVELVGITTTADPDGRRARYVELFLGLLGVDEVPVAAGAGLSSTTGQPMGGIPDHDRYWGGLAKPPPSATKAHVALDLLDRSVGSGASIATLGPYTNLAMLESGRPGALTGVRVFTMGGWVDDLAEGYPVWGPARDWNVQCDTDAAEGLFQSLAALTFVPCSAAVAATLRAADLPRLTSSGRVGSLLARQALAHSTDHHYPDLARKYRSLPRDLVSFHWDPVACAMALGCSAATVSAESLLPVTEDGLLHFERHAEGRPTDVVTGVDGQAFSEAWLDAVDAAQQRAR